VLYLFWYLVFTGGCMTLTDRAHRSTLATGGLDQTRTGIGVSGSGRELRQEFKRLSSSLVKGGGVTAKAA
jgi:hypothetical protein